jgi:hypothetical protein
MEPRVRAFLGDSIEPYTCVVRGRERAGWRAPWDPDDIDGIRRAADALRGDGVRVFLGDGGRTAYAMPSLPALDVIEMARVGAHGQSADWRDVRAVVERAATPFDVVLADEAGLELAFLTPIDPARARALAQEILDHDWIDSFCLMAEEGADANDGDEGEDGADVDDTADVGAAEEGELENGSDPLADVAAYIVGRNALRLWWD